MTVAIIAMIPFAILAIGGIQLWHDKHQTHKEWVAMLERAEGKK